MLMNNKDLMSELRDHITCFGALLTSQCKHGDMVTVGGRLLSYFALPPIGGSKEQVHLELDDGTGKVRVVIFRDYLPDMSLLQKDTILLATGKLSMFKREIDQRPQVQVFAWNVMDLAQVTERSE